MGFTRFMASTFGRVLRFVAGVVLIALGLLVVHGPWGILLAVIGLIPLFAPIFDVCVFAPLFGGPFRASELR